MRPIFLLPMITLGCTDGGLTPIDTDVTSDAVELLGILIQPDDIVLPLGDELQLDATGLSDDRSSSDLTAAVAWSSSDPSVAKVSDGLDQEGIIQGLSVGTAEITAQMQGVQSVPLKVKVTDAELLGLSVDPVEVSVGVGDTVQLVASAAFSDGNESDASNQVRWITADGSVATIEKGLVTGAAKGVTRVHADWNGMQSDPISVNVVQSATADLTIKDITSTGSGSATVVTVKVENLGTAGVSDFFVDVFVDEAAGIGDLGEEYAEVAYLAEGDVVEVSFQVGDIGSGSHDITVVVDTEELIDESNESNNVFSKSIDVVTTSTYKAELAISDFDHISDDSSILYWAMVSNNSSTVAEDFYVDLFVDLAKLPDVGDEGDYYKLVVDIPAWSSLEIEWLVDEKCDGCRSYLFVDSADDVDETNEFNNTSWIDVDNVDDGEDTGWR